MEVLRLRRLDALNVEMGMYGVTDQGLPVVLLDWIEATLAKTLPAMYGREGEMARQLNDFDRAALVRERWLLEARAGAGLAVAAADLAERDRLLEEMRTRLHGGELQFNPPDGFVLGEPVVVEPRGVHALRFRRRTAALRHRFRRAVVRADEKLRTGDDAGVLAAAVDVLASATEAHEARHALDEVDPDGPPPPTPLFEVLGESSPPFVGMADAELRAYLGELHDSGAAGCWVAAKMLRGVYGRGARRTPHFFATLTILRQLNPVADRAPDAQLALLCEVPEAELAPAGRRGVAEALWRADAAGPARRFAVKAKARSIYAILSREGIWDEHT